MVYVLPTYILFIFGYLFINQTLAVKKPILVYSEKATALHTK